MIQYIQISLGEATLTALTIFLFYGTCLVVYRLLFHPLAHFPGPKLAAASKWYEFWFDLIQGEGGRFMYEIDRMHDKYGPIVRINPDELHVNDPKWVDVLYPTGSGSVRNKYPPAARMVGVTLGISGTILHSVHRQRRAAISAWFSKRSITACERLIVSQAEALHNVLHDRLQNNGTAELRVIFSAYTTDVVYEYILGESMGLMKNPRYAREWQQTISAVTALTPLVKQFPSMLPIVNRLPIALSRAIAPDLTRVIELHRDMYRRASLAIETIETQTDSCKKDAIEAAQSDGKRFPTIFHEILSSDLPQSEKSAKRIAEEAFVIISAGGETTGRTLALAVFYLLSNPSATAKLKIELKEAIPNQLEIPPLKELEKLPWLTAVIKESLRLSALVTSRLPVISPDEDLVFQNWVIPAGSCVGMTIHKTLLNAQVYSDPHEFRPQRWIEASEDELERMSRSYVPFNRGSRMCLGINLAYMEMYSALARIFRRFDLQLYETRRDRDVDLIRDCFIGETRKDSPGIRVTLSPVKE